MQHFLLEMAINHLITTQAVDISALSGKVIRFELASTPLQVNFVCTEDKIYVVSSSDEPSSVDIQLDTQVFFSLFEGKDLKQLLRDDQVVIHGDVKTAQLLVDILEQVEIDPEEILSQYTGDIVANELGKLVKGFRDGFKDKDHPLNQIKQGLADLVLQPNKSELFKNNKS